MGIQANQRISEEEGLFPPFPGLSWCSSVPPETGEKGSPRQKRPISRKGGQTPLKPHLLHPICGSPNYESREWANRALVGRALVKAILRFQNAFRNIGF